jgi:hypothetical protein
MNSMIGRRPDHCCADANAGESKLGDRRIDDAHLAELLKQTFRDLVCALIDGDFLAHEEDAVVALHFFAERLIEGVSVCDYWHGFVILRERKRAEDLVSLGSGRLRGTHNRSSARLQRAEDDSCSAI